MKWLYKFKSKLVGFSFLFVYWDRTAEVLEFNIFNRPFSFWIRPDGESIYDNLEKYPLVDSKGEQYDRLF